jgi:hypothetical protein
MYPSCYDPSKLLAYDASVYTFRVSELISSFGYVSVNDAAFLKCFTTALSPLMYVSGSFAYMLSVTWAARAIAQEISGLVLAAQDNLREETDISGMCSNRSMY